MKQLYIRKMAKRTLRVLPAIFLCMAGLLILIFGCLQALKEDGKVKVGVIVPTEDTLMMAFVNTIGNVGDVSSLCNFSMTTEHEGKRQLEQGELSALVVVPENIFQKIYQNQNSQIEMFVPEEPTLDSALMQEFMGTVNSLVLTAKAGDYTAYQLYRHYGKEGSMKKVSTDMNGNYIRFVLRQETLFTDCPIVNPGGTSDEERMLGSIAIFLLFLLGIPFVQLRTRQSASLRMQLVRKGVFSTFSLVVDILLMAFSLFIVLATGISVLVNLLGIEVSIPFMLLCLLINSLCGAAFFSVFCSLNQGTAGSVLVIFVVSAVQFFLAGGVFPEYMLPELCARLGAFLPGGMMMNFLCAGMFHKEWAGSAIVVILYTLLFFLLSIWLKERRRRSCT